MLIPPHLRYWIWGARSLELYNVGTSGFLAFHVAADRCRTTKQTAVVKGTCSIFKAINWIDRKKKHPILSSNVLQGELQPGKHALEAVANGYPNRRMVNSCDDSLSQNPDFHGLWISNIPNCIHPSLPTTSY